MSIKIFDELEWQEPPEGYYLTDVKQKTLWRDEETGAAWVLLKFPPGVANKLHKHSEANQFSFFLSGAIQLSENNIMELDGKLAAIQEKGTPHGSTNFAKETIALFLWDGSPEQEVVE